MADDIIPLRRSYVQTMVERISELEAEIERLRIIGDAIARRGPHVEDLCECDKPECVVIRAAHDAWEEASRG